MSDRIVDERGIGHKSKLDRRWGEGWYAARLPWRQAAQLRTLGIGPPFILRASFWGLVICVIGASIGGVILAVDAGTIELFHVIPALVIGAALAGQTLWIRCWVADKDPLRIASGLSQI